MLCVRVEWIVFSDHHVRILVGWAHVLDVVWVVLSDGENIGCLTYVYAAFEFEAQTLYPKRETTVSLFLQRAQLSYLDCFGDLVNIPSFFGRTRKSAPEIGYNKI